MKITLGRLAGAVLAGALLTLTVAPAALAQEAPATSTEAAPTSEAPPTTNLPTTTPATSTSQQPTSQQPTSQQPTSQPTGTGTPTSGKPTHTSSTPTTEPTDPFPHGDDYIDDYAYAWEFDDGTGILVIACAAGEPTNIVANDFTVAGGPFQDGADGRYWGFDIQLNEGKHLTDATKVSWTCEGKPVTRPVGHGGGSATAGGQVKVTPKAGGVETGGGATARS